MTFTQAMEVSKKAQQSGYAVAVKAGKLQIQTVTFNKEGKSSILPHTGWIDHEAAMSFLKNAK